MNDTDDYEVDVDNEALEKLEASFSTIENKYTEKRDIRSEIEKKLELKELKRLTEDSYNDFVFD
ncbi:MAG: hypothetical protein ACI85N_000080 [Gammaproteobacteria bacterium]|jgi:hypothetical protein